jgi:parallel beta-helix repeat protein
MPTIDELASAVSVSDGDELVVSQSDIARKATRAQLLAGVQPALSILSGNLLGRVSPGTGVPEQIAIGANLTVVNGVISGSAAFEVAALEAAEPPNPIDLIAVAQGGQNAAISYASLMGGLHTVGGIDGSQLQIMPAGAPGSRNLAQITSDAISIESFGAMGDGVTDDTNAFTAAVASGRVLRRDNRVYVINGTLLLAGAAALIGVPGETVIRRTQILSTQPWITVAAPAIFAQGIIFDGGALAATDSPLVSVATTCLAAVIQECQFINATGASEGHGIALNTTAAAAHLLRNCVMSANAQCGIAASGAGTIEIDYCTCTGNGSYGLSVAASLSFTVSGNNCSNNLIGISIGDWENAAGSAPVGEGCRISGNICNGNTQWGIAVAGANCAVLGNLVSGNCSVLVGGGILARLSYALIANNVVAGGACGLDVRTSVGIHVSENHISACNVGLLAGGCQNSVINGNHLISNIWGVILTAIEPTLSNVPGGSVTVESNWIGFSSAQGGGVQILDGAAGVSIINNDLNGWGSATSDQALWVHTDAAVVSGNRWNNQAECQIDGGTIAGLPALVVPDVADRIVVIAASPAISSVLTAHQADTLGQVTFLRATNGGSGYTQAQVVISGNGSGAAANAIVAGGQVVWLVVTNPGSGYGAIGTGAVATISGDGTGASATVYVGLPVIEARRLRIACNAPVRLVLAGSSPPQSSWTEFDTTIPALGAAELEGAFGGWRVIASPPVDYLTPTGDGGVMVRSVAGGNVTLRPGTGGALVIANGNEPVGCSSSVGRGAPIGRIVAVPGSDYRNLDGGAGNTFWIKQSATDASGWFAVA